MGAGFRLRRGETMIAASVSTVSCGVASRISIFCVIAAVGGLFGLGWLVCVGRRLGRLVDRGGLDLLGRRDRERDDRLAGIGIGRADQPDGQQQ